MDSRNNHAEHYLVGHQEKTYDTMIKSTEKLAVKCKFFRAFWYNLIRSKVYIIFIMRRTIIAKLCFFIPSQKIVIPFSIKRPHQTMPQPLNQIYSNYVAEKIFIFNWRFFCIFASMLNIQYQKYFLHLYHLIFNPPKF